MSTPLALLTYTPERALRELIAQQLDDPSVAPYLVLGEPIMVSGTRTRVDVEIDRGRAPLKYWRYSESVAFHYDRLDIGEFFDEIVPEFRIAPYVNAVVLFKALNQHTPVVFEARDVPAMVVEPQAALVTIPMNPASYRWVGELTVRLRPR